MPPEVAASQAQLSRTICSRGGQHQISAAGDLIRIVGNRNDSRGIHAMTDANDIGR